MTVEDLNCVAANLWNEVLHGYKVGDFSQALGIDEVKAQELLARMHACSTAITNLDREELRATERALQLCQQEMGESEFQTRVGVEAAELEGALHAL